MNYLNDVGSGFVNKDWLQFAIKTAKCTTVAAISGYGGSFFFTRIHPTLGAAYIGTCFLIGQISYEIFEEAKAPIKTTYLKEAVSIVQLLHLPLVFHFSKGLYTHLSGAVKLEIISATAYFIAIPIFFYFAKEAWKDPTADHVSRAVSVLLFLASKFADYAKELK